jgi:hypothetical protein
MVPIKSDTIHTDVGILNQNESDCLGISFADLIQSSIILIS